MLQFFMRQPCPNMMNIEELKMNVDIVIGTEVLFAHFQEWFIYSDEEHSET